MTTLQLGNCDLVRLRSTSDGGVAARLCGPALARWRSVHAKCTAASATTRCAKRPDEAAHSQAELRDVQVALGRIWRFSAMCEAL
jgi:hypothetical protein